MQSNHAKWLSYQFDKQLKFNNYISPLVSDGSLILSALASFLSKMLIQNCSLSFYSWENERCGGLIKALRGLAQPQSRPHYSDLESKLNQTHGYPRPLENRERFPNISKYEWYATVESMSSLKATTYDNLQNLPMSWLRTNYATKIITVVIVIGINNNNIKKIPWSWNKIPYFWRNRQIKSKNMMILFTHRIWSA